MLESHCSRKTTRVSSFVLVPVLDPSDPIELDSFFGSNSDLLCNVSVVPELFLCLSSLNLLS